MTFSDILMTYYIICIEPFVIYITYMTNILFVLDNIF